MGKGQRRRRIEGGVGADRAKNGHIQLGGVVKLFDHGRGIEPAGAVDPRQIGKVVPRSEGPTAAESEHPGRPAGKRLRKREEEGRPPYHGPKDEILELRAIAIDDDHSQPIPAGRAYGQRRFLDRGQGRAPGKSSVSPSTASAAPGPVVPDLDPPIESRGGGCGDQQIR